MGTAVYKGVVQANGYDFFLVPISGKADQGAVSPVHYDIIHSKPIIPLADIVQLTYSLSFLYYNWSGPVKMPAPL